MVKLSLSGPQDPADSSLQMKVQLVKMFRLDNTLSQDENYQPKKMQAPKYMPSDFSQEIKLPQNLNSGII